MEKMICSINEKTPSKSTAPSSLPNRKVGRKITKISGKVLQHMIGYNWPGNVRELQHKIERSVLLTEGSVIETISLPVDPLKEKFLDVNGQIKTIHENERDHILTELKKSKGRVWGLGGAAEILSILPSTLKSKMKKLGIRKEFLE